MMKHLVDSIAADGFAFASGAEMRNLLGPLADWTEFAASWDDLGLDTYMADGGRYRKRRHAAFGTRANEPILRKPNQPHYQSRDYNPLNGGIARWFDAVLPEIAAGPSMTAILATCRTVFEQLSSTRDWHIEVHQFRIEARSGEAGQPTPEGMHRDGVDYVLVLLAGRRNIASGVTSIRGTDGRDLGSFTLTAPLDSAWVDDHRVMHGVTPVEPIDPSVPGFRDVLVVTFRREDA
ncbi:MAG TPA: 2OG-Fe dioxygenase family protein [Acetobacteraceae bacterium]|nr:2OG-Fe dioxygenase family protein [Acetobacteraceae bacterium]